MRSVIVVALVAACSRGNPSPDLPVAETWTVADYVKAGVPDPGHPWTDAELKQALGVLGREAAEHRERLPQFADPRSGVVFDRLIAPGPPDEDQPLAARFLAHTNRTMTLVALSDLYLAPDPHGVPPREAVELTGSNLRELAINLDLLDPLLASYGSDAQARVRQLQVAEKLKEGAASLALGTIEIAGQRRLPDGLRRALLHHVAVALPDMYPHLTAEAQQRILDLLAAQTDAVGGRLHDDLVAIQRALPPPGP